MKEKKLFLNRKKGCMRKKKNRMRRIAAGLAFSLIVSAMPVFSAQADETESSEVRGLWSIDENNAPTVEAESAILMDVDTGVILYRKNDHTKEYPASITKLLTCLLARENCELTDIVTFSHEAVYGIERGSSNIGIDEGEQLTMQDCLYATLLESANEVAAGIAEHVGGSTEGFAQMMNDKVRELGGTDSHFVNANGLPDENHYTSAYDMALIARAFFQDDVLSEISGTVFYHIAATPTQKDEIDLRNHHRMLPGCQLSGRRPYEYATGGKNGYTDVARQTLVTCAEKNGHRLVCVVLKEEKPNHYLDSIALFDYGFACYENPEVLAKIEAKALELNPPEEELPEEENRQMEEAPPEAENKMDTADEEEGGQADNTEDALKQKEKKEGKGFSVLKTVVIIVVLAAMGVCCFFFYKAYCEEQERKRRQAEIMARHRARKQQMEDRST